MEETIEFQERLSDESLFSMPKAYKLKFNYLLSEELKDK